jgi:hypothetical protein
MQLAGNIDFHLLLPAAAPQGFRNCDTLSELLYDYVISLTETPVDNARMTREELQ